MGDIGPRVDRLECADRRRHRLRAHLDDAIDAGQCHQVLRRPGIVRRIDPAFPSCGPARRLERGARDGFAPRDERDEITVAHDLDRAGAARGGFVEAHETRTAMRLAQYAGVEHALRRQIVQVRRSGKLFRQVEPRHVPPDDVVLGGMLDGRTRGGVPREIDAGSKPPIIVAGVGLAAQKFAAGHR